MFDEFDKGRDGLIQGCGVEVSGGRCRGFFPRRQGVCEQGGESGDFGGERIECRFVGAAPSQRHLKFVGGFLDGAGSQVGRCAAHTVGDAFRVDSLTGGKGDDVLIGGDGDDWYTVDDAGDKTIEVGGGGSGTDTVTTNLASYTLMDYVENLSFFVTVANGQLVGNTHFTGIGNEWSNKITGFDLSDTLRGMGGDDQLFGLGGSDD